MKIIISLLSIFMTVSCASLKENQKVIWVNNSKVDCQGMVLQKCLQIQEGEFIDPTKWTNLFDGIKGFEFVPGQLTKMIVSETKLPAHLVPADASNIEIRLVKVLKTIKEAESLEKLEGKVDKEIQGKWGVSFITDIDVNELNTLTKKPFVQIDKNRISGNNGCNNFFSTLKTSANHTLDFGFFGETKMLCPDVKISDVFMKLLQQSKTYKVTKKKLIFLNKDNQELIILEKIEV